MVAIVYSHQPPLAQGDKQHIAHLHPAMQQPYSPKVTRHYRNGMKTAAGSLLIGSLTLLTLSDQSRRLTAADSMADKMHRKELKLLNSLRHCVEQGNHKRKNTYVVRTTTYRTEYTLTYVHTDNTNIHTYTHHDHYNYSLHYILSLYTYIHTFVHIHTLIQTCVPS